MKRLLVLLLMLGNLAFAQDIFTGSANYYRTNEPRYEHRFNIVSVINYGPIWYLGDFILNEGLGDPWFNKRQFKNMAGVNITGGFSVRYQNDDYYNEILVRGKIKPKTFNEDRYGLGYRRTDRFYGVTMMNDFMALKSNIADRRSEWNLHIGYKRLQVKHQLWYDYIDGHQSGYYEKLIIGCKTTEHTSVQWRSEWMPNKKRVDMVGMGVSW